MKSKVETIRANNDEINTLSSQGSSTLSSQLKENKLLEIVLNASSVAAEPLSDQFPITKNDIVKT